MLKSTRAIASVMPFFMFAACGGSTQSNTAPGNDAATENDSSVGSDTATPGSETATNDAPVGPTSYTITYPAITVAAGVEDTQCVILPLNNANAVHIGAIHNILPVGSHHMIVYSTADTAAVTTPFDCQPFSSLLDPTKGAPLMITQKPDDLLTLPTGVGVTLAANQFVRLELHYINTTSGPLTLSPTATFEVLPDSEYQNEMGFLFMGDIDVSLPPKQSTTLGPIFAPVPTNLAGVNFFAITGHEHKYGTNVAISTATGSTDPAPASIYSFPIGSWLWNSPTTVFAPFTVPDGGGFQYTCQWDNTGDTTVNFGESATDEMCFFWTYYYPAQPAEVCFHSDKIGGGAITDLCCPQNTALCPLVESKIGGDTGDAGS